MYDYFLLALVVVTIIYTLLKKKKQVQFFDINDTILGYEEYQKHAVEVSRSHRIGKRVRKFKWLLDRVNTNYSYIKQTYDQINYDTEDSFSVSPSSEWLMDNFYVIQEQVDELKSALTKRYKNGLPVLKAGLFKEYPRAYAIATEILSHNDGSVDYKLIKSYINSYQSQTLLTMSELWALQIMIRIVIVEYIRQICEKILDSRLEWQKAEKLLQTINQNENFKIDDISRILEKNIDFKLNSSFVEHLLHKIKRNKLEYPKLVDYLITKLSEDNMSIEKINEIEHQIQASRQVSIGNAIKSLRNISELDWHELFEELCHVEKLLKKDPSNIYSIMDMESRELYRKNVQKLSRLYNVSEVQIATKALECAEEKSNNNSPFNHIGYYIIGDGFLFLKSKLRMKNLKTVYDCFKEKCVGLYIALLGIATFIITIFFVVYAKTYTESSFTVILAVMLAVIIPASELALTIVNAFLGRKLKPQILPKLELNDGIPDDCKTMVIVPTLLPNVKRVKEIADQLEVNFLANKYQNIYYALIGDFKDCDKENMPDDEAIKSVAIESIKQLNLKYSKDNSPLFFYFNRHRSYNKNEKKWMGWERKRGAIVEFNRLLKGSKKTNYSIRSSDISSIPKIKYVITIDADTKLPIGAAKRLVSTIMHPLNQPIIDEKRGVVIGGYGLLQPRIIVSLESSNSTLYSKIFAGQGGIDPYTTSVSDIYQDMFKEGIFTGKGLYDLDTFIRVLDKSLPENRILSHDLLEGSFLRTGLVSDIEMVDGYPSKFNSFVMRLHRWVRGDWQLIHFLLPTIRDKSGNKIKNPLSGLSKWKIFDNLRRSVINTFLLILFISSGILPGNGYVWISLALITASIPILSFIMSKLLSGNFKIYYEKTYSTAIKGVKGCFLQSLLTIAFIPYIGYLMADAIIRTLVRVVFTHKKLLEWVTAADMENILKNDLKSYYMRMWISPITGIVIAMMSIIYAQNLIVLSLFLLILWTISPFIAYRISQPIIKAGEFLEKEQIISLRLLSRKIWAFYEDFAGEEDNYLPPDNFQEEPTKVVAHRTSPTNIGFLLLAYISARDFGYITTNEMLNRMERTIATLEKMDKWNGHLYNWYDTKSMEVLRPRYVSTVDSGNLACYMLVAIQALKDYINKPSIESIVFTGLLDGISLCEKELQLQGISIDINNMKLMLINSEIGDLPKVLESIQEHFASVRCEEYYWGNKLIEHANALNMELNSSIKIEEKIIDLSERINNLYSSMEFSGLFSRKRKLFSIGYNAEEGHQTRSYYDMLASEARQTSFLAVARGEVDKKHWFKLGRKLVAIERYKGLISWTGTMFEYLMPLLIMRNYENTLLSETYKFVVKNQIKYCDTRNIPWGISESGYSAFDISLNYQYHAFGIPQLGLKRGLENDVVIAPYATVLAIMVEPQEAMRNLIRIEKLGVEGRYGFYEAVDYTPDRLRKDEKFSIVKSFMAHHQGMSLIALDNFLNNNIMQQRFHSSPVIKAAELLLHEKIPSRVTFVKDHKVKELDRKESNYSDENVVRQFGIPSKNPQVHMLSNGNYSVMLTDSGLGYSKVHNMGISRWSNDILSKKNGMFIFITDNSSKKSWSSSYEPFLKKPDKYKTVYSNDKVEYYRRDGDIETHTQVAVSPEENVEIRKVNITNYGQSPVEVDITSYSEIILTQQESDIAHPAFSNLFIKTEFVREYNGIIASRRPRLEGQKVVWSNHSIVFEDNVISDVQFETDRFKFIGRNRDIESAIALSGQPLTNTDGAVLDPVMCLRVRVILDAGITCRLGFITGVTENRSKAVEMLDKYKNKRSINRAFELAHTRSQIEARYLGLSSEDIEKYLHMLSLIIFPLRLRRLHQKYILENRKGQSDLWPHGISGDIPIALLIIRDKEELGTLTWLLKAHEFWRAKGLMVDLVILLDYESSYIQILSDTVRNHIASSHARELIDTKGGVFVKNAKKLEKEDINLLHAVAVFVIDASNGNIDEQIDLNPETEEKNGYHSNYLKTYSMENCNVKPKADSVDAEDIKELLYFNGLGGFKPDGSEYIIKLKDCHTTPAPWSNVIANQTFGFNITEVGSGYTWSENSRENKLTSWSNDPVSDPSGEIIYLKDNGTDNIWTITPMPIRLPVTYTITHGIGYSSFYNSSNGLNQRLTMFVSMNDSVKYYLIKLKNTSGKQKSITLTYYMRPVLGVHEQQTSMHIVSNKFEEDIIYLQNNYSMEFKERVAFVATSEKINSFTCDRREFIGCYGSVFAPEGLNEKTLSGKFGAGYDPCVAININISLENGREKELVIVLGQKENLDKAKDCASKYKFIEKAKKDLAYSKEYWNELLNKVQISTPDESMNILSNKWLLYQVVTCRLWARAAFYQSGGAYGYRDQLQDVMALAFCSPETMRKQILIHARHQFVEGDVQHWWHAEAGKGIRTKYSDDLLWLPYVTCDYIQNTEDYLVLDEIEGYLESTVLDEHEDERYEVPSVSINSGTIYEHCINAIKKSLKFGEHGIPLMGSGDWNDGMNTVGNKGKGESVWLGWFLYTVLQKFIPICKFKKDIENELLFTEASEAIVKAIEENAWDGNWYKRAYFDDGTPLGSMRNTEGRIDSISQSWAVISGAGQKERAEEALNSVENYLINEEEGIIKLLTPPFDSSEIQPGYIKGYVPGVRENGGQYTHAATWVIMAFAKMGKGDRAWELYNMINPINHTRTSLEYNRYKLEPYVMAADVYSTAPHIGRGGWSWYTGAAGWMYRIGIEYIIGLKKVGNTLVFNPSIPKTWPSYSVVYKHEKATYNIQIKNPDSVNTGVKKVFVNGIEIKEKKINLSIEGNYNVEVIM